MRTIPYSKVYEIRAELNRLMNDCNCSRQATGYEVALDLIEDLLVEQLGGSYEAPETD